MMKQSQPLNSKFSLTTKTKPLNKDFGAKFKISRGFKFSSSFKLTKELKKSKFSSSFKLTRLDREQKIKNSSFKLTRFDKKQKNLNSSFLLTTITRPKIVKFNSKFSIKAHELNTIRYIKVDI